MNPLLAPSVIRLDYATGTTPLDRLRALAGTRRQVALVSWPNSTPYAFGWDGRDRFDYAPLESQLDLLQREEPGLKFVLSFGSLHGAPYYWARDHPGELAVFHCGRRMQQASLGSRLWREHSSEAARRFAQYFAGSRFAQDIVGFFPYSTGVDWHGVGETFVNIPERETPAGVADPLEGDFSVPMLEAFRAYLESAYLTDEALQEAWRTPSATRSGATLPSRVEVRSPSPRVRDYFECYNRLNAVLALAWSEALKRGAPGSTIVLPYGYAYGWPAQNLHPQGCGHNAPELLLRSSAVDALIGAAATPVGVRCSASQHAVASLHLHGKISIHSIEPPSLSRSDPADQCRELTLAVGSAAVRGSLLAWGERRHGVGSMQDERNRFALLPYDAPEVRRHVALLQAWHASHLEAAPASVAEVATFTSPRGAYQRALDTRFNRECIEHFRNQVLARAGFPVDDFLLMDFAAVADRYKAWIFIDCPDVPEATWRRITRSPARAFFATAEGPVHDPGQVRRFAATAGVHLWCKAGDSVQADAASFVFTAHTTGSKRVSLPRARVLHDVITGERLGALDVAEFHAAAGDVRLFDML